MKFNELLNKYLEEFNCSSKTLSELTNISPAVISRYRSGERTPAIDSKQLESIIKAIKQISNKKYKEEDIEKEFKSIFQKTDFDYDNFSKNLNELINTLKINIKDMSKYTLCDASSISRIRYGKTKPSEPIEFASKIASYVTNKYANETDITKIEKLTNNDGENLYNKVFKYLTNKEENKNNDMIKSFLNNLDKFNLNDYIKAIKFDELKVPTVPFYITKTKNYFGLEEMKKAELDFLKGTVLSKNNEDIFMCSDMPMEDLAKDIDFSKKWMFGIACLLKKGIHLNIIHNLDRPFNEMMLGLESWIPLYMTGQINPFYFKDISTNIYHNLTYVSGTLALAGECINNFHKDGKYFLTSNKKEVDYYKTKSNNLLKKANNLMNIYKEENSKSYNLFLDDYLNKDGDRKRILSSLPLFTMSDDLLNEILKNNKVPKKDINKIINYKNEEFNKYNNLLKNNNINDIIYILSKEEFNKNVPSLSLSNIFYDKKIKYSYETYLKHLKETKRFANKNNNYILNISDYLTFNNISITIFDKKQVIISKEENPTIHFVIKHPKLVNAINNFNPLVKE
ncbi:hypothetical protein EGP99_05735 [bacterium]|nr:hypothetical protein [bacterium]